MEEKERRKKLDQRDWKKKGGKKGKKKGGKIEIQGAGV